MLGYWINYGFYFYTSSVQWRFPLLFQSVFAIYVVAVTLWLPETPRWLMQHEPTPDRGTIVLAKLRGVSADHPVVQHERAEILDAISLESQEKGAWSDLFKDHGIQGNKRFYLAVALQFLQEMSGNVYNNMQSHGVQIRPIRHQHRHVLCANVVPTEPRHVTRAGSFPWLFFASVVSYSLLCYCKHMGVHISSASKCGVPRIVVHYRSCRTSKALDFNGVGTVSRARIRSYLCEAEHIPGKYWRCLLDLCLRSVLYLGSVIIPLFSCLILTRSRRLDGNRLALPTRDLTSQAPRKGCRTFDGIRFSGKLCGSSPSRLKRQNGAFDPSAHVCIFSGRPDHTARVTQHWIQDVHHLRGLQLCQCMYRVGVVSRDGRTYA